MRLYHVFSAGRLSPGDQIILGDDEARHLIKVRRVREGNEILVLNGEGIEARAVVVEAERSRAVLEILAIQRQETRPSPEVQLALALTRSDAFEETLHRAIELGITAFRPIDAEHGVVRLDEHKRQARMQRWHRLACERIKQCERLWLPALHEPLPLKPLLQSLASDKILPVVLTERAPEADRLWAILERNKRRDVCFLVGPEGGWDQSELEVIATASVVRTSLGPAILRAETAAIAAVSTALAIGNREFGESGS